MTLLGRDAAVALSLANLCFFAAWGASLPGSPGHYLMKVPPQRIEFVILTLNVAVLAASFLLGMSLARRSGSRWVLVGARMLFLGLVLAAANGVRRQYLIARVANIILMFGRTPVLIAGTGIVLVITLVVVYRPMTVLRGAVALVLVLSPFALLTIGRTIVVLADYQGEFRAFAEPPRADSLPTPGGGRKALWLIFDELDQRMTFVDRLPGLQLPELDRFRAQALYATNAYPPAGETLLSMPALITGRRVWETSVAGVDQLMITFADTGETVEFGKEENIFSRYRAAGLNTSLVGYYHPYCRILAQSLTSCWWNEYYFRKGGCQLPGASIKEVWAGQVSGLVDTVPLAWRLPMVKRLQKSIGEGTTRRRQLAVQVYRGSLEETEHALQEKGSGLVFAHFSVPHPPNIYNRAHRDLVHAGGRSSYFDNLALADRTLGELRAEMEKRGVWDRTDVIVTSDHWYRTNVWQPWKRQGEMPAIGHRMDYRVPFLVKLAGQTEGVSYDKPFNTVVTADLLLAMGKEISDPSSLIAWLDRNATMAPPVCGFAGGILPASVDKVCPGFEGSPPQ